MPSLRILVVLHLSLQLNCQAKPPFSFYPPETLLGRCTQSRPRQRSVTKAHPDWRSKAAGRSTVEHHSLQNRSIWPSSEPPNTSAIAWLAFSLPLCDLVLLLLETFRDTPTLFTTNPEALIQGHPRSDSGPICSLTSPTHLQSSPVSWDLSSYLRMLRAWTSIHRVRK